MEKSITVNSISGGVSSCMMALEFQAEHNTEIDFSDFPGCDSGACTD